VKIRSTGCAAREYLNQRGLPFKVITEREFPKVNFSEAITDPDVIWKKKRSGTLGKR